MTQAQRFVVILCGLTLTAATLYAPHSLEDKNDQLFFGYGWIFSPPPLGNNYYTSLNLTVLAVEWALIVVISGIAWWLLHPVNQIISAKNDERVKVSKAAIAWRRLVATHIDYVTAVLIVLVIRAWPPLDALRPRDFLFDYGLTLFFILVAIVTYQAVWISAAGTTPGKALLGIRIVGNNGNRLSFRQALLRSIDSYVGGYAAALLYPVLSAILCFVAYRKLDQNGQLPSDIEKGVVVTATGSSALRLVGGCAAIVVVGLAATTLNGYQTEFYRRDVEAKVTENICQLDIDLPPKQRAICNARKKRLEAEQATKNGTNTGR